MLLKEMNLKEIIKGLTYHESKYSSEIRASDNNRTVIIKNISKEGFNRIKGIDLDIIDKIEKNILLELELEPDTYKSVMIIKEYIEKSKNKKIY